MAREHARILCSIWRPGDDFRDRSPGAQRLYFLLLSQRELNNAGVMPLMIGKWSRCSAATTPDDIRDDLAELDEHRYVVVDHETEELLIRTFIRNDGVAKQPNILKNALRLAVQVESPTIRVALGQELLRIGDRGDALATALELDPNALDEHIAQVQAMASGKASHEGSPNPSAEGFPNPSSSPAGRGGGRGRGSVPSVGGSGGGDARARDDAPGPPPPAPQVDPTNPRCARHRDVPADDPGPNCRQCRDVRLAVEAAAGQNPTAAAAAAWRAAVDACTECDSNGKLELPSGALVSHHDAVRAAS
jgi:hypothetical protein